MVDWNSPDVLKLTASIFDRVQLFFLGFYSWQYLTSLHCVEWPLLTRRIKFRLSYIPYFIGRYAQLANCFALVIVTRITDARINCAVAFTFFNVLGNVAISASSTNLLIRALALWKHKQGIRATLLLMSITQWIIGLIFGILSSGVESEHESQCGGVFPNSHKELTIFFFYSVVHDSCILIFTIVALASKSDAASTRLWLRVYRHNYWYLIVTVLANVPVAILAWFNLNPIMDLMFAVSATTISVIVSSVAVTSLMELEKDGSNTRRTGAGDATSGKEDTLTTHIELARSLSYDHISEHPSHAVDTTTITMEQS